MPGENKAKMLLLMLSCAKSMEPDQTAHMEQSDIVTQRLLKRQPKYNRGKQNIKNVVVNGIKSITQYFSVLSLLVKGRKSW